MTTSQEIGPRTAWQRLAARPEPGTLARGQTAVLAGLAPYNPDRGPQRGQRQIAPGRPPARTARDMAALVAARQNPIPHPLYPRLRAVAKPAKVALVPRRRKLAELASRHPKIPPLAVAK